MSRYLKNRWPVLGLIALILGLGTFFGTRSRSSEDQERIGRVTKGELVQRVTIAGSAEPLRSTIITAPYDGYIKKLYVKLGDQVKAGDPLVSLAQSLQASENVFPVRAPFSGVITQALQAEGEFVKSGDTKDYILRLDDLSKMNISAKAAEIDVVKVKVGLESVVKISAILNRTYKGVVREIDQAATSKEQWGQRSQVEYSMKVEVKDADAQLKPGMTALVDIITFKKSDVLMLDHEFVYKENDDYYVITKKGARQSIKVGAQNESAFEITSGLKEGDEVQQVDFTKVKSEE